MGRKSKNKILAHYERIKFAKVDYQDLVDRRREEVEEVVIAKNRDFRTFNIVAKEKDIKKERQTISNKTFQTLYAGYISAKNKEKYISKNRDHILKLSIGKQQKLVNVMMNDL